jgi:hypothetical protein
MDPVRNPFSPGAGSPPRELAGRGEIVQQAKVLLARIRAKRPEKSILMTGLRGVGKTVLLLEIERWAQGEGYRVIHLEAQEQKPLAATLVPPLRRLLYDLDRVAGAGDKARRGLRILKSFLQALRMTYADVEFGLDLDAERGAADSGHLETDLPDLLIGVAEAAEERGVAVAVFIDEIQYFSGVEVGALITAMHRLQQLQLPLALIAAGLPILPGLAGESKSYAERLFSFPHIGPLAAVDAAKALQDPVRAEGAWFEDAAVDAIYQQTNGYPYFLQEWGYQSWNHATQSPITRQVVEEATERVRLRLDQNFFRVRFDRLTPAEKRFLRGMAELGAGPHRSGDIADILGGTQKAIGPVRASLIRKGMIYSPAHGEMAFTVPLFDEFMRRAVPELERRARG